MFLNQHLLRKYVEEFGFPSSFSEIGEHVVDVSREKLKAMGFNLE